MNRKRLSDILQSTSDRDALRRKWAETKAADDFGVLPLGEYVARIIDGELFTSRTNQTPGYRLTFRVDEGELIGRRFWHEVWLSAAALPMAKRDLGKLGVSDFELLDRPLPPGIVCAVRLVVRRDDDGTERNRVQRFEVLRIDAPEAEPFAPSDREPGDDAEAGAA